MYRDVLTDRECLVLYRDGKAVDSIVNPESKAAIEQFIREALAK